MDRRKTKLFTFLIVCFATIILESVSFADDDHPEFAACTPKDCGRGPTISYPFWINGLQESYCGYPDFEVTCEGEAPILKISNDSYVIKQIYPGNDSIHVVRQANEDETCPIPLRNSSFDDTPFISDPNSNLYFFFDCRVRDQLLYDTLPVECASNISILSNSSVAIYSSHRKVLGRYDFTGSCKFGVSVPVIFDVEVDELDIINATELVRNGFMLNWTAPGGCSDCEASGGHCGSQYNSFACYCSHGPAMRPKCSSGNHKSRLKLAPGLAISASLMAVIVLLVWYFCFRSSSDRYFFFQKKNKSHRSVEAILKTYGSFAPKRYTYSEVKKFTNSFKNKLGEGGYGGVYQGKLSDSRAIAVKMLKESEGSGEEFINEVASISRTSHVNIVTLMGFCFERTKRALIYEFIPNGSLEKFIYDANIKSATRQLGWETLFQIALGIARGLDYLHRGCNTRIVHFDIKPHNILLDEEFCPKIADFGLSKLCPNRKDSILSMMGARGTPGYTAPELFCRSVGNVSHKSDVYSYGMMILEMVGGRKNIDVGADHTSEIYFPHWIHGRLHRGNTELELHGIVDEEERVKARKMIIVGLWCIQTDPNNRPAMHGVLDMLHGSVESLRIPPLPIMSSSTTHHS